MQKRAAPASTDAITLLTKDHQDVKELFRTYDKLVDEEGDDEQKAMLAVQICTMLTVHAAIEEEIFYPAARAALTDDQELLDEAQVEHASAKDLIAQILEMEPGEALYDAKVRVLGEYIDHHVKEEQDEMFPKLRKAGLDLQAIGEALSERKEELMADIDSSAEAGILAVPKPGEP
jgi:hemerythrin-like domain-containing protein